MPAPAILLCAFVHVVVLCTIRNKPAVDAVLSQFSTAVSLCSYIQKEGMGLLEYQAMPFCRDIAHDGVLCTFGNRSAPDRDKWCGARKCTKKGIEQETKAVCPKNLIIGTYSVCESADESGWRMA